MGELSPKPPFSKRTKTSHTHKGDQMTLNNALKKLSRYGEVKQNGRHFSMESDNQVIEFYANGNIEENPTITCIRIRRKNDHDDSMTDYSAGVWCDNITQALKLTGRVA